MSDADRLSYGPPTPASISAGIKAERVRLGLTTRRAAEILGVGHTTYSNLERARSMPGMSTLFSLVDTLGLRLDALVPELIAADDRSKLRDDPTMSGPSAAS